MTVAVADEKATQTRAAEFRLNCLIEQTEGVYVGWCIETGTVATSTTDVKSCVRALIEVTCEHIRFALENDNPSDIFNSAPRDVVNKFLLVAKNQIPEKCNKENSVSERRFCGPLFSVHPAVYAAASL